MNCWFTDRKNSDKILELSVLNKYDLLAEAHFPFSP